MTHAVLFMARGNVPSKTLVWAFVAVNALHVVDDVLNNVVGVSVESLDPFGSGFQRFYDHDSLQNFLGDIACGLVGTSIVLGATLRWRFRRTSLYLGVVFALILGLYFATRYRFYHSWIVVTEQTYNIVTEARRRLVRGVASALEDHGIRYVLGHGNLLEFTRGKAIVHDDDVDVRVDVRDFDRWMQYCARTGSVDRARGLSLRDARRTDASAQRANGLQISLLDDPHPRFGVHVDVVPSVVSSPLWTDYSAAFTQPVRRALYLGVPVRVPSAEMAERLLRHEYGPSFLVPDRRARVDFEPVDVHHGKSA